MKRTLLLGMLLGLLLFLPSMAAAQGGRVEVEAGIWNPFGTNIQAAGERGGIPGTPINVNSDFGLTDRTFFDVQVMARVTRRQRFIVAYTPLAYESTASVDHDILFAGTVFPRGVPTTIDVSWRALRGGYEYDFIVRRRWGLGALGEIDRTAVRVRLHNATSSVQTSSSVPTIPSGGLIVRAYPTKRLSLSSKFALLYVPDRPNRAYGGHYLEADAQGVYSLTNTVGAEVGFRLINIRHLGEEDSGTFRLHGLLVGLVWHR